MSAGERDQLSRLHTLLVFLIFNGTAKTKLAILAFLCCREIVINSNVSLVTPANILQVKQCNTILSSFPAEICQSHSFAERSQ